MAQMETARSQGKNTASETIFIYHVDLDCFFASIEMRENPALRKIPLIVGGDKKTRKGVVLTCNYKAREYNIHSGMSVREALRLCPSAICVSKHRHLYKPVSEKVMNILSRYSDNFRQTSIDEAYLDLTNEVLNQYNGNPLVLAQEIKKTVYLQEGITCSIGVGPNTTIAKMATSQNKPNGITVVSLDTLADFLQPLSVQSISGIGPKTAKMLKEKYGIETIGQIMRHSTKYELIRKFGRLGLFFYRIITGQGRTTINPKTSHEIKSISKGKTFFGKLKNGHPISEYKLLRDLTENVHQRLIEKNLRYKTVTLEVKFQENLKTVSKSKTFLSANDDKNRIQNTVSKFLKDLSQPGKPIRKLAVRVSNLENFDPYQKRLSAFFN
ncbi:MAG: DNA polymerase IV [Asgard group archaeon]|nr:DNA polymerase IV [Asgard group archaeon]